MQGRKTYLLAAGTILAVIALDFLGWLSTDTAFAIVVVVGSGFAVTFRSAIEHHHQEALAILGDIAETGVAARTHNRQAEIDSAVKVAEQGAALASEVSQEAKG